MKKNVLIPENLVVELREIMTLKHSGKLVEALKLCMEDNIHLLNEAKVFRNNISEIKVKTYQSIEYGIISENIIHNAIGDGRAEHNGSKKLITALFIGCYGKDWRDRYCQFYNTDGTLISREIAILQVKQTEGIQKQVFGNISFDSTKFNILILPFYNPEDSSYLSMAGHELKTNLFQMSYEESLDWDVQYLACENFDFTDQMARNIGKQIKNTSLIIWGRDSKPKEWPHKIFLHYLIPFDFSEGFFNVEVTWRDIIKVQRLVEISEGKVFVDLKESIFLILANKLYLDKDFKDAIDILKNVKYEGSQDYILCSIARCFFQLGKLAESKSYFERALLKNANNPLANKEYGMLLLLEDDKYTDAKKYFQKAVEVSPDDIKFIFFLAILFRKKFDFVESNKYFMMALSLEPNRIPVLLLYADFLQEDLKNFIEAERFYKKALVVDPENVLANYLYYRFLKDIKKDNDQANAYGNRMLKYYRKENFDQKQFDSFYYLEGIMYFIEIKRIKKIEQMNPIYYS